jgi:integrase
VPRSVVEEVAGSLAARPHSSEALVFTAPMGGPLSRADFVRNYFNPAVLAANEAIGKEPKERRPAPLPDGLRFYDLRHTCASLLIAQARASSWSGTPRWQGQHGPADNRLGEPARG